MVDRSEGRLRRPARVIAWALPLAVLAALSVRTVVYVRRYTVDVLFWDQWDFLDPLFRGAGPWAQFDWQHGPHRQGLGGLLLAWVLPASGWSIRAEALVSALIVIAAAATAWATLRRATGAPSWSDVLAPLLCLGGGLQEIFVGASNPAHGAVPMALVFALALAWTVRWPLVRTLLCVVLGALCVFTGFGFFVGLVQPVLFAAEWVHGRGDAPRRRAATLGLVVSAVILMAFFVGWQFLTAVDCFQFPHPRPGEYLDYLGFLLCRPLGMHRLGAGRTWLARGVALAALVFAGWVLVRLFRRDDMPGRVVVLLIGFTALFALNTTLGRVCTGLVTAGTSRYVPYVVPGWIAVVIAVRCWVRRPVVRGALLGTVLILIAVRTLTIRDDEALGRHFAEGKQRWVACYRQRHDLQACDLETGFPLHPAPAAARMQEKLDYLEARRLNLFRTP
ncbi:MAG TPA: hypothetical protein VFD38_06505 [Myxococcaceae bacterium]|nr:hypothetical protein [Myxococcaceae bacterium]